MSIDGPDICCAFYGSALKDPDGGAVLYEGDDDIPIDAIIKKCPECIADG
jgi:hypothetical protein